MVRKHYVIWRCCIDYLRAPIPNPPALGCWYICLACPLSCAIAADTGTRVGGIIYIASLIGFLLLLLIHLARFVLSPRLIPASIAHPAEGLFVSTFAAALGILIIDGATYSQKMHTTSGPALRAFYWIFVVVAVIFSVATPLAQ